jgi:hypothetical protein
MMQNPDNYVIIMLYNGGYFIGLVYTCKTIRFFVVFRVIYFHIMTVSYSVLHKCTDPITITTIN